MKKNVSMIAMLLLTVSISFANSAQEMVAKAAKNFSNQYCKNYVSKATWAKSAMQNGKYVQFTAAQMIFGTYNFNQSTDKVHFLDDANMFKYVPLTIMQSDAIENGAVIAYVKRNDRGRTNMAVDYIATPGNIHAFLFKRAIEVYGPLNPAMVDFFDYQIDVATKKGSDNIVPILFKTRDGSFPSQTRILASGKLYYNKTTAQIESVVVDDMVDYFSRYIYSKSYGGYNATPINIEINYVVLGNQIFTESIAYTVKWQHIEKGNYSILWNARANPDKTRLVQSEVVKFSDFTVDKTSKFASKLNYTTMGVEMNDFFAPYLADKWRGVTFAGVDMSKVSSNLSISGNSFDNQVVNNGAKSAAQSKRSATELYSLIFGHNY